MAKRIQIVVVILIAMVLASLIVPAVQLQRAANHLTECANGLKSLALTLHTYNDVYRKLPSGWVDNDDLPLDKKLGLFFQLFPFVQSRMDLAGHFPDARKAWDAGENRFLAEDLSPIPCCPVIPNRDNNLTLATYVGLAGVGKDAAYLPASDPRIGVFGYNRQLTFSDIKDGKQNTVAFAETATENGPWMSAGTATLRSLEERPYVGPDASFSTNHTNRTLQMAFVDSSVRWFSYSLAPEIFEALVTVAGNEQIPWDQFE